MSTKKNKSVKKKYTKKKTNNLKRQIIMILVTCIFLIVIWSIFNYDKFHKPYHAHSDILVVLNGEKLNLSDDKYQTSNTVSKSKGVHLHDNVGEVIHFHERGITLKEFFQSIGMNLGNDCFKDDLNYVLCSNSENELRTFVNGNLILDPENYVPNDLDRILVVYGRIGENVTELINNVSSIACIQSESCPEKGLPTPEDSCAGDTCAFNIE